MFVDCGSGRISPIMTSSPTFFTEDEQIRQQDRNELEGSCDGTLLLLLLLLLLLSLFCCCYCFCYRCYCCYCSIIESFSPEIVNHFSSVQGKQSKHFYYN